MAETLGQAVLELRTDDSAFTAGVNRAEVAATGLGKTLDMASGSSVALADKMRASVNSIDGVTRASGAQRMGFMQLTQQLGDVSAMYALGARPAQIFASQIGQTTQAVQLMAGEGSKFARFLGGPWGLAITTAVLVLGPLLGNLLETSNAMEKVRLAANNLSNVQGALGNVFDLTTGKIKNQTEATMALARATLELAKAEAQKKLTEANRTIAASGEKQLVFGGGMGGGVYIGRERPIEGQIESQFRNGMIGAGQAMDGLKRLYQRGLITQERFIELTSAYANSLVEAGNVQNADKALGNLDSGSLSPEFRQKGPKGRKDKAGKSQAEIDAEFLSGITSLNREELQARLALASDAGERLEIQKDLLEAERQDKIRTIEATKGFSAVQKQAQIAIIKRLYGEPGKVRPNGEIVSESRPGLLNQQDMRQFEAEQTRLANDMLQRQAETAQAWAQVAPSTRERARLEAEALKLQQQIQTNLLEQQIASGQIADADKARAELRSQQAAGQAGLALRYGGPLDQYAAGLDANKRDTGLRVEALMVQELDYVHRSIGDTIASRMGVEDPFLRGLIDMFVEDVFIRPFAEALQKQKSGGGGLFSSLIGSLFGGGAAPQASLAGDVASTIGDPQFAGLFAEGGTIPNGSWGIVGDGGLEAIRATAGGIEVMPNSSLRAMGGGGPGVLKIEISGARGNAEIEAMVRSGVAQGLAAYDSKVAGRVADYNDRRG